MHAHRLCIIILTTFYHMCHLLYSATGDVVKVVYTNTRSPTLHQLDTAGPLKFRMPQLGTIKIQLFVLYREVVL